MHTKSKTQIMSSLTNGQINSLPEFKEEYDKIIQAGKGFPFFQLPEWKRNGDYFTKFSMYSDFSSGKTTTQTSININELNA